MHHTWACANSYLDQLVAVPPQYLQKISGPTKYVPLKYLSTSYALVITPLLKHPILLQLSNTAAIPQVWRGRIGESEV